MTYSDEEILASTEAHAAHWENEARYSPPDASARAGGGPSSTFERSRNACGWIWSSETYKFRKKSVDLSG